MVSSCFTSLFALARRKSARAGDVPTKRVAMLVCNISRRRLSVPSRKDAWSSEVSEVRGGMVVIPISTW